MLKELKYIVGADVIVVSRNERGEYLVRHGDKLEKRSTGLSVMSYLLAVGVTTSSALVVESLPC